jgi:hypothetical protein
LAKIDNTATPTVFPNLVDITADLATIQDYVNGTNANPQKGIVDNIITNADHSHKGKPANCDAEGNNG